MSGWNPSTASALSDFAEIRAFSISDWQKNSETYTESGYYAFNENDDEKKYIYTVKMLNESQNNSVFVTRSIVINNFSVISY